MTNSFLSIAEVSELLRQKKASPIELVTRCLKRIGQFNPSLNAFITVTADQALKEATIAEKDIRNGKWKGPLHGIPVAVKDNIDTAWVRTTSASDQYKDRIPTTDAEVVTKLKNAGAILIGKSNLHELAGGTTSLTSYYGSVHNPWNEAHIAGGSSGGSAAAVAAGLCYAAIGTDADGSCRLPPACCGITGFKATYGLIGTRGIFMTDEGIDHASVICRTAEDAAIMLNTLVNTGWGQNNTDIDYRASFNRISDPRIGIVKNFKASEEIREGFRNAIHTFNAMGYVTTEIDVPLVLPSSFDKTQMERDRDRISTSLFKDIDVLILPTTTAVTPSIAEAKAKGPFALSPDNTFLFNYYGLPAISVPCGFSKEGLPLGLQIAGPRWGDSEVLDMAYRYQQATRWHLQYPAMALKTQKGSIIC